MTDHVRRAIKCETVPSSSSPLSQGITFGNLIFLSGQMGRAPETGAISPDFAAQTKQTMENLKTILESVGSSMNKVLKTTIYVTDITNVKQLNPIYEAYFDSSLPARSCVQVAALGGGAQVEIELIAAL